MINIKSIQYVDQIQDFTDHQAFVQRVVATSASCASIAAVLIAMYFLIMIEPKRLVFRHQLIFFLLIFDLLKAVILLIYPTRVLTHSSSYYNRRFCNVVGFFTATAIQGADIAILSFALHTYLLIFKPSLNTRVNARVQSRVNNTRVEGGLYKIRYLVYSTSILVPLVFASLAFIGTGYDSLTCWCYLPMRPVWYRLVLSWVPRWCIVVAIFVIYALIYIRVVKEIKGIGRQQDVDGCTDTDTPMSKSPNTSPDTSPQSGQSPPPITCSTCDINVENMTQLQQRQKIIQKQMKSIFVYPLAYCFVWMFPFILQATQFNYEETHHPVYWLNVIGAFMQPFFGFVDSMVFFYRERPWKYTGEGGRYKWRVWKYLRARTRAREGEAREADEIEAEMGLDFSSIELEMPLGIGKSEDMPRRKRSVPVSKEMINENENNQENEDDLDFSQFLKS